MPVIVDATLDPGIDAVLNVLYELRKLPVKLLKLQVDRDDQARFRFVARFEGEFTRFRLAMFAHVPGIRAICVREEIADDKPGLPVL